MQHKFVILIDGELKTYTDYDSIPQSFDNVIEFRPYIIEGPHTHEEHDELSMWNKRLQDLMKRETK
jgi:hypothetical protein